MNFECAHKNNVELLIYIFSLHYVTTGSNQQNAEFIWRITAVIILQRNKE